MRSLLANALDSQSSKIQLSVGEGPHTADALRTAPRSSRYLRNLARLDAPDAAELDASEVIEVIETEFGLGETVPLGCVARCYLGPPYEVHVLDLAGGVVEHYFGSQPLPTPFERARRLALHDAYVAIEVYPDRLVCVRADGTTAEINQ
jgi:hypothetical protein